MPTFQTFNILIFLATLTKASRSHSLKLSSSSLFDQETSDRFSKSPSPSVIEGLASPHQLQSALAKYSDALDEKSLLALPLYSPMRKSYRSKPRRGEIISNEIEDISRESNPYSRYLLLRNIIPNIPRRSSHRKDPIAQYFDKMRKIKAIKEALRLKNKKERARLEFEKAVNRMKTQRKVDKDGKLEETRRPMKFRRAKVLTHGHKFQTGRDVPNFKTSTPLLDRPIAQDFRTKPQISFPDSPLGSRQSMSASSSIMFPPESATRNSGNFGQNAESLPMGSDMFFANPSPKFTSSLRPSSKFSHSLSSLTPSQNSEFFDLPIKSNPSGELSQIVDSGHMFYEMPDAGHHYNVQQPPVPGSVTFQDGFHSFSIPFDGVATETKSAPNDGSFPASETWGAGGFVADDSGCANIKGKSCQSDLDCNCFGFYTCMAGKCHSKQMSDTRGLASQPLVDGWHDQPVDFGFVKRKQGLGPFQQYSEISRDVRSTRQSSLSVEQKQGTS